MAILLLPGGVPPRVTGPARGSRPPGDRPTPVSRYVLRDSKRDGETKGSQNNLQFKQC